MKKSFLKPLIGAVLIGSAFILMPFFILRIAAFFIIGGALFRLFVKNRMKGKGFAFADKIRSMSDDEYSEFKTKFQGLCMRRNVKVEDVSKTMI